MVIRKEDNLWKGLLDEIFPDFIRFIYPAVDEFLDLKRGIEFLDKELEQLINHDTEPSSARIVDKLVKAYTYDGEEEFILIHIEIQAKYNKDFSKRMFTYFYRLLDKYNKPISAFAIFTEANTIARSDTYKSEFMGTKLIYKFKTYKITESTDEELEANENPFALVVLAARTAYRGIHIKDERTYDLFKKDWKIELFQKLQSKNIDQRKMNAIWNFINHYILFDFKETRLIFDNELKKLTKTDKNMGIEEVVKEIIREEGFEEGKKQGVLETLKNLTRSYIFERGYSDKKTASLLQVTVKFVKDIRSQEELVS